MSAHSPTAATPAGLPSTPPTPLWAAQVLTFLCSVGTGLVTNGIYYLTEHSYGFTRVGNLGLAFVMGLTYIIGAAGAGPLVTGIRRAFPRVTSRGIFMLLMLVMAAICLVPAIVARRSAGDAKPGVWVIWLVVLLYSPMTGVLWPMVEAFLSGGRSGRALRSAIGMWNVVWSGAIIVAYLWMSQIVERSPAQAFTVLAGVHVLCAALLITFEREPAPHLPAHDRCMACGYNLTGAPVSICPECGHATHEPHPPVYARLLVVFRMLLPLSYFVLSSMNPVLPNLMATIGIGVAWRPIVAIAWLAPRTLTFFFLERWHGWHGTWGSPIAGALLMITGFAMTVLSPLLGAGNTPAGLMIAGLMVFGTGMAVIYSGAIYYAMEVGRAEVEAGGTHEALIGLGYTLGPGCGLGACGIVASGVLGSQDKLFEILLLTVVSVIAVVAVTYAVNHARARAKEGQAG